MKLKAHLSKTNVPALNFIWFDEGEESTEFIFTNKFKKKNCQKKSEN